MNCFKGNFSLVDNCWNELTESFEHAPCQPTICQKPGSIPGEGKSLPDRGLALIICVVVAIFGGLAFYFLKKSCKRGFSFILGGVLAGSMTPPLPRSNDVEAASRAKNLPMVQGGGQDLMPTAPPLYEDIMVV